MSLIVLASMTPHDAFGPTLSFGWALIAGGAVTVLSGFALWRALRYQGHVLRAQSMARHAPALAQGPALLVGKVETDDGGPAVRIEIDQVGKEWQNKSNWHHRWDERHRAVQVRPFRLRLPTDEVVRVVPDERARLVDDLATERHEGTYRKRVAELSLGEKVWVSGQLAEEGQRGGAFAAYRTGPAAWVMRGAAGEPLEMSSGGLERQFAYWRGFYKIAAVLLGVLWLIVHGPLFGPYYVLFWTGKTEVLQVTRTSTYVTKSKNSSTTHYVIHATLPLKGGARELDDEVSYSDYLAARAGTLKRAPFIYSPLAVSIHAIGEEASLGIVRGVSALMITLVSALIFLGARRRAMPWYEQRKVVELGSGRLDDSAWNVQVAGEKTQFVKGPPKAPPPPAGPGFTKT